MIRASSHHLYLGRIWSDNAPLDFSFVCKHGVLGQRDDCWYTRGDDMNQSSRKVCVYAYDAYQCSKILEEALCLDTRWCPRTSILNIFFHQSTHYKLLLLGVS
jgi:hypothetical protein